MATESEILNRVYDSATDRLKVITGGDVASGTTDSGNPTKIGGVARTTNPTAVSDGQRVGASFDKLGKQVVVGSVRELKGKQTTIITSSTSETTIVTAGAAGVFNDVYKLIIANTSATATEVTIRDTTTGTGNSLEPFYVPAGDTRGFTLAESGANPQTTAASNWTAQCGTSVASIKITAHYIKNT